MKYFAVFAFAIVMMLAVFAGQTLAEPEPLVKLPLPLEKLKNFMVSHKDLMENPEFLSKVESLVKEKLAKLNLKL